MQEKLGALVRTQAMQLFRQQGLHFTMQQVAEPLHISKKTIYTVYPSKEALLLDMVDHAFAEIHRCKQEILAGGGTLQEKLRAVIIAMPAEYAALDLRQMKELDEKYPVVAGLDVYEEEADYFYQDTSDRIMDDDMLARLLSFNNVILTSHQGFFTREALDNIARTTLENIQAFSHGECLNEVKYK